VDIGLGRAAGDDIAQPGHPRRKLEAIAAAVIIEVDIDQGYIDAPYGDDITHPRIDGRRQHGLGGKGGKQGKQGKQSEGGTDHDEFLGWGARRRRWPDGSESFSAVTVPPLPASRKALAPV